jgi:hypothetical protein
MEQTSAAGVQGMPPTSPMPLLTSPSPADTYEFHITPDGDVDSASLKSYLKDVGIPVTVTCPMKHCPMKRCPMKHCPLKHCLKQWFSVVVVDGPRGGSIPQLDSIGNHWRTNNGHKAVWLAKRAAAAAVAAAPPAIQH